MFFPSFHTTFKVERVYIIHDQGLFFPPLVFFFKRNESRKRKMKSERKNLRIQVNGLKIVLGQ